MSTLLQQLYKGEIFPAEQYRPFLEEYKVMRKNKWKITIALFKNSTILLIKNLLKLWMNSLTQYLLIFFKCSLKALNSEQK